MLKRLGLFCYKELASDISFELPEHVTVNEENNTCFLESVTTRERIYLKIIPAKSSCSLSVTYEKYITLYASDLAGHMFHLPRLLYPEPKVKVLGREIGKQFLVTKEIFHDHIAVVLSETSLSSCSQKLLATYISELEAITTKRYRRGFMIEVDIRVVVDHLVHIGYGCKGREACPMRVISDRHVATKVIGTDCAICLTELSGEVGRMELRCSHVFHTQCVMTWLDKHTSCPVCRTKAIGEMAIFY